MYQMRILKLKKGFYMIFLIIVSCAGQPEIDQAADEAMQLLETFETLDVQSSVKIYNGSEPGRQLKLCLTVRDRTTAEPVINREVTFFHTDDEGNYDVVDQGNDSTARLRGMAKTDSLGRIFIHTILPGNYGSSSDNRHIHTSIAGATPKAYDIHFKHFSTWMFRRFVHQSDQHFLADLYATEHGVLIGFVTISLTQ